VLLNLMDAVDDTVLVRKTVIAELQEDLLAVATHKSARSTLLHLLAPRQPRYLAPQLLACLPALDTATGEAPYG
jgi:pumilio family protein 6